MPAATQASAFGAATRADRRFRAAMMAARPRAGRPVYPSQAFAGSGVQVQAVRDFVAGSFAGHPAAADAVLVASELAANAIMFSLLCFRVAIAATGGQRTCGLHCSTTSSSVPLVTEPRETVSLQHGQANCDMGTTEHCECVEKSPIARAGRTAACSWCT